MTLKRNNKGIVTKWPVSETEGLERVKLQYYPVREGEFLEVDYFDEEEL